MRTDWTTPPQTNEEQTRTATPRKVGISRRISRGTSVPARDREPVRSSPEPVATCTLEPGAATESWTPPVESRAAASARGVYSGRFASYTRADLLRLPGVDAEQVAELDRSMGELGFQHLGDLHSSRTAHAVFRVYGQPESSVYAILLKSGPRGGYEPELYTSFEDGASLTTSIACRSGLSQDRKRKTLRFGAEGTVAERFAEHIEMVWQLSQQHGGARPAEPTLAAFAETLDELLLRVRQ